MSVFEARHIAPEVKKAIFKKIEALNKIGIATDNPTLDPKGDTTNSTPSFDTSISSFKKHPSSIEDNWNGKSKLNPVPPFLFH